MKTITLLTDYRHAFCSNITTMRNNTSMDVSALERNFSALGYIVEVIPFAKLDLLSDVASKNYIYTSSEDSGLLYKSYIEDVVLALEVMGANVLPRYALLRAHHNKVMMELLRIRFFPEEAAAFDTVVLGSLEELEMVDVDVGRPKVVKAAFGAGSSGVTVARTRDELAAAVARLSRSRLPLEERVREHVKRSLIPGWHPRSLHRNKVIIQNLIPDLPGDFKVLCFGNRRYILYRENRPNDFRASGSGIFSHEIPSSVDKDALLHYAHKAYAVLDAPVMSLDIAFDGTCFYLIEFQAVHFGTLTAESSAGYYYFADGEWRWRDEHCDIEHVYCDAIDAYVNRSVDARCNRGPTL